MSKQTHRKIYEVIHDPDQTYGLTGLRISTAEIKFMLRFRVFTPGTMLKHRFYERRYFIRTPTKGPQQRIILKPPEEPKSESAQKEPPPKNQDSNDRDR